MDLHIKMNGNESHLNMSKLGFRFGCLRIQLRSREVFSSPPSEIIKRQNGNFNNRKKTRCCNPLFWVEQEQQDVRHPPQTLAVLLVLVP